MELLYFVFSLLTGWSLGHLSVYYRRHDYDRYWMVLWYAYVIPLSFYLDDQQFVTIASGLFFMLTALYTYVPMLSNGNRVHDVK